MKIDIEQGVKQVCGVGGICKERKRIHGRSREGTRKRN